jgi:hypothetical protein
VVKGTPSRQVAQTPWARSRSTLAGSGTKAAKNQRPSTWHAASPSELPKALRLFVQLDETQSHWIPFDLYIILSLKQYNYVGILLTHLYKHILKKLPGNR